MTFRKRLAALLMPLLLVGGMSVILASPAQASTVWYMNCTHYAYRLTSFEDYTSNTADPWWAMSRGYTVRNGSGNTQLFEFYYRNGTEPWQPYYKERAGVWLAPGQSWLVSPPSAWRDYRNWFLQVSDGHRCYPTNR